MLGQDRLVAFLATTDGVRARRFYEGTLGLRVISDDDYALALTVDGTGTTLRIQKVAAFAPQPFTALGWQVSDVEKTVQGLRGRGVEPERYPGLAHDGNGVWQAPSGARVVWFRDPDGNVLSLTQL